MHATVRLIVQVDVCALALLNMDVLAVVVTAVAAQELCFGVLQALLQFVWPDAHDAQLKVLLNQQT